MKILITGASSGFGRELALKYARHCEDLGLYLIARRGDRLKDLESSLREIARQRGARLEVFLGIGDVCDKEFVRGFASGLDLDILVNNAGLARGVDEASKVPFGDWEEMIEVNIKALSFLTHLVLPGFVAKGGGHIVNVGSIAGSYPYKGSSVYGASKAFVSQFSKNLRAELFDKGVRVSNIEPGLCAGSDFSLTRFHGDAKKAAMVYAGTTPLQAADIAEAIFWVTSQPPHININHIEIMPTTQASAGLVVHRPGNPGI